MINSGLPEFFDGCLNRSACSPYVIKQKIGGLLIDWEFGVELVSDFGLGEAGSAVGADLDGVFGADEEFGDLVV